MQSQIEKERAAELGIGQVIRRFREAEGKRAIDVARMSGINPRTLAAIETGRIQNPSLDNLRTLAKCFGVTLADFFSHVEVSRSEEFYHGDQKGEYSLEFSKEGFRVISYVPVNPDFFIGKMVLGGKVKVGENRLPLAGSVFVHVIFGKLELQLRNQKFFVKEGSHFMFNGSASHILHNPLLKDCSLMLVTIPSFLAFGRLK